MVSSLIGAEMEAEGSPSFFVPERDSSTFGRFLNMMKFFERNKFILGGAGALIAIGLAVGATRLRARES